MTHSYLDIVTQLAYEVGVTPPTTCQNQTGDAQRLCLWARNAWDDIQKLHQDWEFMRNSFSGTTVSQQATYTPAQMGVTDLGQWKLDSFRIYTTSTNFSDEMLAAYMDYDEWRNLYQYGAMRTTYTRPVIVTVSPIKGLGLGPVPDSVGYTVVGEYYRIQTALSADADVPLVPDKAWMATVYKAMMSYGAYYGATEVYDRGKTEFDRMIAQLESDMLPMISFGEPLA